MKKFLFIATILFATPAMAINVEKSIKNIKEDLAVLQRQVYQNNKQSDTEAFKDGTLEEDFRDLVGKVDNLEHKIKTLSSKIDLINKDVDVRIAMIENKPIAQAPAKPAPKKEKFVAKVAEKAPKEVTGENINSNELKPIASKNVKEIYKSGIDALNAKNYPLAEQKFNQILKDFAKEPLAANAQYWVGESYYAKKEWSKAAIAFAKGYKSYPNSNKGADCLLKLGMSMKELNKKPEACSAFKSMSTQFPKAEKSMLNRAAAEAKKLECK